MTTFAIPTSTELSDYTETIELDGATFTLRFRWNTRMEAWLVDIFDASGAVIVYGRRCTVDSLLVGQLHHLAETPLGEIVTFDTTHRHVDPKLNDFGDRVLLLYFEAAELEAA